MPKRPHVNRGFTLVEMSIVFTISGILLTMAIETGKPLYIKKKLFETRHAIDTIVDATNKYFGTYGRYPCVASMSAAPDNPAYGVATDCTDHSVPPGTCNADYCVAIRTMGIPPVAHRVRIGSVPFRDLHNGLLDAARGFLLYSPPYPIGAEDTIDSYKNRFTSAVPETQATDNYSQNGGAIRVHDEFNHILHDTGDYVLVSHGRNGIGARTFYGTPTTPCATAVGLDQENCNMGWSFVDALRSDAAGPTYYDDTLVYRTWLSYFLWNITPANADNIHNMNTGNVGIGLTNPLEKLHLKNGGIIATGNLRSNNICDDTGHDCFSADIIGGTALPACPPGQALEGIAHSAGNCKPTLNADNSETCGPHKFVNGFQYNTVTKKIHVLCISAP